MALKRYNKSTIFKIQQRKPTISCQVRILLRSECFKGGFTRSQHKIDCRHKPKATKLRGEEPALPTETHIELNLIIKKIRYGGRKEGER